MDHDAAVETGALEHDMLRESGFRSQSCELNRLILEVVLSDELFLLQAEINLPFLQASEYFAQVGGLEFVLEGLSVRFAIEMTIELFAILVDQVILDVGAAASCKLGITRQRDLNLVRGQLLINLLLIDHCLNLD